MHARPQRRSRYWRSLHEAVMVYDLQEVVLSIFENHEDALCLEDDLDKVD